jgi:hypothetical protein
MDELELVALIMLELYKAPPACASEKGLFYDYFLTVQHD